MRVRALNNMVKGFSDGNYSGQASSRVLFNSNTEKYAKIIKDEFEGALTAEELFKNLTKGFKKYLINDKFDVIGNAGIGKVVVELFDSKTISMFVDAFEADEIEEFVRDRKTQNAVRKFLNLVEDNINMVNYRKIHTNLVKEMKGIVR
jgi:hypothetical protein